MKDLLDVDVDVNAFLPPDTISDGFDNVADAQTFSPTLMEGYLRAASRSAASRSATAAPAPTSATYKVPRTGVADAPRRRRAVRHARRHRPWCTRSRPTATIRVQDLAALRAARRHRSAAPDGAMDIKEQIEVSIDGERVALLDINPRMSETDPKNGLSSTTPPIHIKAGPQRLSAAFVQRFDGPVDDLMMPIEHTLADVNIALRHHDAAAPARLRRSADRSTVTGVSDTPSRRKIFTCRPTSAAEEETCAAEIVRKLATQAYRGAVDAGRSAGRDDVLRAGPQERRLRGRHPHGACRRSWRARASCSASSRAPAGGARRRRPIASATTTWPRACRSSCGAPVPDAELLKAARAGHAAHAGRCSSSRCAGCWRIRAPRRCRRASRRSGCACRTSTRSIPDDLLYPAVRRHAGAGDEAETELFFDSIVREDRRCSTC